MHLNNKGFGLREMLLWVCVILVFLIIAIYYIAKLYDGLDNKPTKNELVIEATNSYIKNKFNQNVVPYKMMITLETLRNETTLELDDNCSGYVIVNEVNGENEIKDYINCEE